MKTIMPGKAGQFTSDDGDVQIEGFLSTVEQSHSLYSGTTVTLTLNDARGDFVEGRHAEAPGEGWMGGIGFGLRVPRKDVRCAVCGRTIKATEGRLQDMPPAEYARKKMVHWNDFSRPLGDTSRVAHPSCLRDLQDHPSKWPAGLHYAPIPVSDDAARQTQARKKMEASGMDRRDAFVKTMWTDGKEPAIVSELVDGKAYRPRSGDVVSVKQDDAVVHAVVEHFSSLASSLVLVQADGSGGFTVAGRRQLEEVRLISRDGKLIDAPYKW